MVGDSETPDMTNDNEIGEVWMMMGMTTGLETAW
jgi:hypothetical protein